MSALQGRGVTRRPHQRRRRRPGARVGRRALVATGSIALAEPFARVVIVLLVFRAVADVDDRSNAPPDPPPRWLQVFRRVVTQTVCGS